MSKNNIEFRVSEKQYLNLLEDVEKLSKDVFALTNFLKTNATDVAGLQKRTDALENPDLAPMLKSFQELRKTCNGKAPAR